MATEGGDPKVIGILYEDEGFIAVHKPSGLLSHPNPGHEEGGTLLDALRAQGVSLVGGEDPLRQGLVHRLDRDTSGVLLCSKTELCYNKLQDLFRLRQVQKEYHFPASGKIRRMEFSRSDRLARHPVRRTTQMVSEEGRDAYTHFKMLKLYAERVALWEARPKTGRTHQIRVHARAGGLSILGDPHYSERNSLQGLPVDSLSHTMLHCFRLNFPHPLTQEQLSIEAPYPEDFKALLSLLEGMAASK